MKVVSETFFDAAHTYVTNHKHEHRMTLRSNTYCVPHFER